MVSRFRLFIVLFCCLAHSVVAGGSAWLDRVMDGAIDLPVIGVPMIAYSPETNWAFGGALQGYFRCEGQKETSVIQLDGSYSLNRQWYLHSKGTVYVGRTRTWIIQYDGGYRDYPDKTFERGNRFEIKPALSYLSYRGYIRGSGLCAIGMGWSAGPQLHYFYERAEGVQPTASLLGLGGVVRYDTRDTHFYPRTGVFFQLSGIHYESFTQDLSRMGLISTDLRHYIPLYKDLLFAWQFRSEWSVGTAANRPFQFLPTLGGEDLIRGVRMGMFRDDAMLALQGELRFPVFSLLSGAVFAGVGDVYCYDDWRWTTPKVGYGIGLRLKVNKANINVRVDLARNNLYKSWTARESYSFYLTVTEAF